MSFEQSSYAVNENSFVVNPVLVVSNLVSKRFNVRVFATDGSATGRHLYVVETMYIFKFTYREKRFIQFWYQYARCIW